jgi:predicted nucleic acid-binding protein
LHALLRGSAVSEAEARLALRDLGRLNVDLVGALALAPAISARSAGHSTYDAHYVALAAALPATLLTTDENLAAAASSVAIELVRG